MTAEKLLRDQVADKITDGQTVRLGRFVNRVGGNEAARPGNVIDNDSRVAGYVFTDVASHDPGIRVEATASRKPPRRFEAFSPHRNPEHMKPARNSTSRLQQFRSGRGKKLFSSW